jgi:hypothetical protein
MLEHLYRQHRVERITTPFEIVQIAADVRLFCRIDIEPHVPRGSNVARVRRRFGADVQHDARSEPLKLSSQLAIEGQSIDRPDPEGRDAGPE